ncbi:MAG: hypothetical protein ACOCVF_01630 [bacterium]
MKNVNYKKIEKTLNVFANMLKEQHELATSNLGMKSETQSELGSLINYHVGEINQRLPWMIEFFEEGSKAKAHFQKILYSLHEIYEELDK